MIGIKSESIFPDIDSAENFKAAFLHVYFSPQKLRTSTCATCLAVDEACPDKTRSATSHTEHLKTPELPMGRTKTPSSFTNN